ncbi:UDP-glucuronic acid decarboxylase 1 [Zeugodacus cucurbitae]|uniref:UDP-glucuronic acid decarboxylase 1 n=1 Tax=Zeugodacus cucurbitae TaxID=28588 RepID=UPI0005967FC4|nr:UDP-glucuronic acid decarboxylase 1 [Zeugodacus cucurbitae]XP_011195612.1 UDP-glucuronic acid decarboxylase 1 [Zeugodacus cucurbitae]
MPIVPIVKKRIKVIVISSIFLILLIILYRSLLKHRTNGGGESIQNFDKYDWTLSNSHIGENAEKDLTNVPQHTQQQLLNQLEHAKVQIAILEDRVRALETSTPRKYPQVKYLNYKNRKRILITGGAGFVGSHLVDTLMVQGHEVIVADNFFTGRKRNVEHWLGHENFELIHHDIVNPLFIEVDEIYHLASPASPPHYMYNPVKTIKTNTMGTINMLGLAKRVMAKVLIASTSEVYGDPTVHPQPETYWGHVNPIGPRACYDEGKRVSETLSYAYAKQENVKVRVARIFNTYGPRMHMNDGRVVSNFILQALRNETITVYGNGKQTRSFQYVSDLVDGLISLMASNYTQPVNLGNPVEHTIEEFAWIIKKLVGGKSEVKQTDAVEDDPQRRKPDITRAKTILNWEPKVPLQTGLYRTISYFRHELERSDRFQKDSKKYFDSPDLERSQHDRQKFVPDKT